MMVVRKLCKVKTCCNAGTYRTRRAHVPRSWLASSGNASSDVLVLSVQVPPTKRCCPTSSSFINKGQVAARALGASKINVGVGEIFARSFTSWFFFLIAPRECDPWPLMWVHRSVLRKAAAAFHSASLNLKNCNRLILQSFGDGQKHSRVCGGALVHG